MSSPSPATAANDSHVLRPMTTDLPTSLEKEHREGEVSIRKHPIYYFDDGSLILDVQVERFKLHHALLSRHSRYFSSITLPNQSKGFDLDAKTGHYHVVVEEERGVKPKDVEALLQHFYHDKPLWDNSDFSHVSSLLRITSPQQFDFPQLHTTALRIFETLFPKDPSAFAHKHPLHEALDLAKQFKLDAVRKAVLYSLMTTTEFDTTGEDEGSNDPAVTTPSNPNAAQVNSCPNDPSPTIPTTANVDSNDSTIHPSVGSKNDDGISALTTPDLPLRISKADAAVCMTLMTKIVEHFTPILFTPAATPHMECTDVFADTWMKLVIQPAIDDDGVYKPLETLEKMKSIDWAAHGLCPSCVKEKDEEWTDEQRTVWSLMDKWLGIDTV
ncbi:hypothetical protein CVT24_002938 [Panaeolus cyanescens]|uniref:BTB domain-containing protein n=1 Tax=Panaeolus cyanescens TaxID=181874 RepID=A0A409VP85_9AGAR|nr:hypothetical protein CVT24_002938 [Panaeolus cyanescens]